MAGNLKQITVRLPSALIARANAYKDASGVKLQAIVAFALAEYLDKVAPAQSSKR